LYGSHKQDKWSKWENKLKKWTRYLNINAFNSSINEKDLTASTSASTVEEETTTATTKTTSTTTTSATTTEN